MENTENITTEVPHKIVESTMAYLDRLGEGHEKYAEAVKTLRERNARVADVFTDAMMTGQREAIELSKTLAAEPTAYAKNMDTLVQAMSGVQERALEVAKTLYREQAEAAGEYRAVAEKTFEASKAFGKPFEKMTAMWMPAAK
jgi:lipoate synthase